VVRLGHETKWAPHISAGRPSSCGSDGLDSKRLQDVIPKQVMRTQITGIVVSIRTLIITKPSNGGLPVASKTSTRTGCETVTSTGRLPLGGSHNSKVRFAVRRHKVTS
jgi:hypothetical protein